MMNSLLKNKTATDIGGNLIKHTFSSMSSNSGAITIPWDIRNTVLTLYSNSSPRLDINEAQQRFATPPFPTTKVVRLYSSLADAEKDRESSSDKDTDTETLRVVVANDYRHQRQQHTYQFDVAQYFGAIQTHLFGQNVIYAPLVSSTQTLCLEYFAYTQQGLVMLVDQQTSAKGRGNNKWVCPLGSLLFSYKIRQSDGNKLPFLQYLVGIAMVEAIKSHPVAKDINVRLKWPNDIYGGNLKIGGILCQSNYLNNEFDVVAGVGLNISNDEPTTSLNKMIRDHLASSTSTTTENSSDSKQEQQPQIYITREQVLSKFFTIFEEMYIQFNKQGFDPFVQRYLNVWMHSNQIVTIKENDKKVKIIGLEKNGFLKAVEVDPISLNEISPMTFELHPDGTSFDINELVLKKKQ
ncbi:hypothetical protein CYY_004814 [Polysphondylium violaceum]|uniref:BPL/LPL catalytic domain-containing protein n=1 Tax=Polysphondylium violaceum TaxID=133409 RepID=A0A8J4UZ13_9MYCE|nr:hypothetical protein CYY_004814 [Polysphondylium violaceum]